MICGHERTIHRTKHLDVELDDQGNVAAVWFRCLALPFRQTVASQTRAADMRLMYGEREMLPVLAIEIGETPAQQTPLKGFLERWIYDRQYQKEAYKELQELFAKAERKND